MHTDVYIVQWEVDYHYEVYFDSTDRQLAVEAYEEVIRDHNRGRLEIWNGSICTILKEL